MSDVTEWPAYDVERTSVRVVLRDAEDRILLFRTVDPTMPEIGQWWELPGGGMEPGESYTDTAIRELREETGFEVAIEDPDAPPRWTRDSTYVRRHRRTWQHEVVVIATVVAAHPVPSGAGRTPEEKVEYVGHRWWSLDEVAAAVGDRFFPGRLPELLTSFLAGDVLDEPFDHWN